ncbi:hypothetical protein MMC22_007444 [Lobaria immixta]|nr:hypothetical protein [Lobaria immixta]
MTVFHVALLEFKPTVSSTEIQDLSNECLGLKEKCLHSDTHMPYLKSMAMGKDISIEGLSGGFTHIFVAEFESVADRDYYIKIDPVHQAVARKVGVLWAKGHTVDFEPGKF